MSVRVVLRLFCAILLIGFLSFSSKATVVTAETAAQAEVVQSDSYRVKIFEVLPYSTPQNNLIYRITYEYEFKGLSSVHILGLGPMPAKAKLHYYTGDKQLEFRRSGGDPTAIVVVPLTPKFPQGAPLVELADVSKFTEAARVETWRGPSSFQERALKVLNKYFSFGLSPFEKDGLTYYVTSFRGLTASQPEVICEVALLVSYPYANGVNPSMFHVQLLVRERRIQSSEGKWRYGISDDTKDTVEKFINDLIREFAM